MELLRSAAGKLCGEIGLNVKQKVASLVPALKYQEKKCGSRDSNFPLLFLLPQTIMASVTATPTLTQKHSGVPERLTSQASRAKDLLYSRRTVIVTETSGKRKVQLPPYTSQETFDDAIRELKKGLGEEWVVVNDGALVDGWYCEHPYVWTCLDIGV